MKTTLDKLPAGTFAALVDNISFRNGNTYRFSFEQEGACWRAYILAQPSYGDLADGMHETHRLPAGGRHYVCWTPEPSSLADMKAVAEQWARRTERYLATGLRLEA